MRIPTPRTGSRLTLLFAAIGSCLAVVVLMPSMAAALTLDFDDFAHGEVVGDETGITRNGITVSAYNETRGFHFGVAFDSERSDTRDADLEAAWSGGNLPDGEILGRILVLQENSTDCASGVCSEPDDEARRPAGMLTIEWDTPTDYVGFDLIDIDDVMAERGSITLYDALGASTLVDFEDVAALSSGVDWGNNTANRIEPLMAELLGLGAIVKAEFRMGGSGGIDNISFNESPNVPEPTAALMVGLGLIGLGIAGRRTD